MKTLVILQSNYIPWKGYFDLMAVADEFVLFDEAQFTRRDWRNRNKIIIEGTTRWLTVSVQTKGNYLTPILDIKVADREWAPKHWQTIRHAYRKAPFFDWLSPTLEEAYGRVTELELLSEINNRLLRDLAGLLGIATPLLAGHLIQRTTDDPTGRLIEICLARGATHYVSGPAARGYIDKTRFERAGLVLEYANYDDYPVYDQGRSIFEHGVSVIDLLMRVGPAAREHLKSPRSRSSFVTPA
jgi:hypothetical protein